MRQYHESRVSVIVPLYNQRQFVGEAIESVLKQTYENIEIIVVNDGSTDHPHTVLEKFGDAIVIINQENRGLSAARNAGIRRSSGEYLQFLDADDCLYPDKIQMQLLFSSENQADATYCELDYFFEDSREFLQPEIGEVDDIFLHYYNLWNRYPTPIHSLLLKRTLFQRFGLFPELLRSDEDRFLMTVMAARGVTFLHFPFRGGFYRVHGANMTADQPRMIKSKIKYYQEINRALGEDLIVGKTGYSGQQMMQANLTHLYLMAVSGGSDRGILRQIRTWYRDEGVRFDAQAIPSRFRSSLFSRKLLAAYLRRWFRR